jgi:hypothetical protein
MVSRSRGGALRARLRTNLWVGAKLTPEIGERHLRDAQFVEQALSYAQSEPEGDEGRGPSAVKVRAPRTADVVPSFGGQLTVEEASAQAV